MTSEQILLKTLAKKHGLTVGKVREAVRTQERFVGHVLKNEVKREEGVFPSIRLPGFGLFYCPEKRKEILKKHTTENASI